MKQKEKLMSFHFDCGNSTTGQIGFCGRIRARTREEALRIMKRVLPTEIKIHSCAESDDDARAVEYLEAYISPDNITLDDVDDGEEIG